ncbi:hypothetical protein GCM10023324_19770 [Streptomyces youssoufiensis]
MRVHARAAAATPELARTSAHYVSQDLADAPTDVLQIPQTLRDEQTERARAVVETVTAVHR